MFMHRRLASFILLLSLGFLLSACGFQLRGVGDNANALPESWKSMYLSTDNPNSEFSNYRLELGPELFSQRNLSLNSEARVAEFELNMTARFSVIDADNQVTIESTEVAVIRQMENDPRNVVGKSEEVRIIKSEMRADLARQIMRRIGFFATGKG